MAKQVQLYDSRGRVLRSSYGGANRLIGPAQQNTDRKRIPLLNADLHRNVSKYGRTILLSLGRHIYFASGAVRGAVEDVCKYAAGNFMFESRSESPEWKAAAEELLWSHDRFCDLAGPPNTLRTYRKLLLRSLFLDGDMGTIYVDGEDGMPYLQVIPGHRICYDRESIQGGPFDGARVIDGVIVDGANRAIGYCVRKGDDNDFAQIPAASMALHFQPLLAGQVRGLPVLGLAAWDMQDLDESRRWELLAQKAGAGRVFQEWNEEGEPTPGADFTTGPAAGDSTAGTPSGLWREAIDGGLNTYFKANTGSRLEAVSFDRPSSNQQAFAAQCWREALSGSGLSIDFNLDLSKIGGAPLRVLIDKINANHADLQAEVLEPACRRFDFFRLGTFIDRGKLSSQADWFQWEYQPGRRLTADKRYDSAVNAEELRIGVKTRARAAMENGEGLADIRATRKSEVRQLFQDAKDIAAEFDVPFGIALNRLESDQAEAAVMSTYVSQTTSAADDPTDPKDTVSGAGGSPSGTK